ncbi:MAG: lipase/acyltransferase domain-containing protein [Pyrinomonadaceae bacterium]
MRNFSKFFALFIFAFTVVNGFGQTAPVKAPKAPVIIIPGITGSDLYNKKTNKQVWLRLIRPKDDDIRLPMSPDLASNRDLLEARDIIRSVKIASFLPEIEIYERLIYALETRGGYREAKWNDPGKNGFQDTFYVFPYDWRRDNVENARLLIDRIEALKAKLKKPNLKFNIIAHSMGGLIARYAAMYGDADIPGGPIQPTWAGSKHLDKIFLLGTPNDGSILALRALLQGQSLATTLPLPILQSFSRFDAFTVPSIFEMLPTNGGLVIYDENFKPLKLDVYDPNTWDEYDWSIWEDPDFDKEFNEEERRNARPYFLAALQRARRFQEALRAVRPGKVPVGFYLIGGDCKDTPAAAIVLWDEKNKKWETVLRPRSFTRTDGTRISEAEVKAKLSAKGDGTVTLQSLVDDLYPADLRDKYMPVAGGMFQCEDHTRLVTNTEIQDKLLALLK